MSQSDSVNAIHIGCAASDIDALVERVHGAGGRAFEFTLAGVASAGDLVQRSTAVFEIPWPVVGLNSVLSVGSELYWMDCGRNFVTVVHGVEALDETLRGETIRLLVGIVSRMTGAGDHYSVAFPECGHTDELRALLDREDARLSAPPTFPWNTPANPIPVVDHREAVPTTATPQP